MIERAEESLKSEATRIILVDDRGAIEVTGLNERGNQLLGGLRTTLDLAINQRLIAATPFDFVPKPEVSLLSVEPSSAPISTSLERTLELAIANYRANPDDPSRLAEFNQAHWDSRRMAMGLSGSDLVVPQCPYSEDDLRSFWQTDFGLFVPQVVSTAPEGLVLLGKADPRLGSWAFQEGTSVRNVDSKGKIIDLHGWMRTEKAIDAPHTGTNQKQAEKLVKDNGRIGDSLNVYAAAGVMSKELIGQYLDQERTWIRVLSSRDDGRVVGADFDRNGCCRVYWGLRPDDVSDGLGLRSVELAKA